MMACLSLANRHFHADLWRILSRAADVAGTHDETVERRTRANHNSVAGLGGLNALVHAV